ncbi:ubiquinone/menaquinone biosynthesis methyltransferase [Burkholderia sp. SFA1]|uniref:class I SAM-dependent methyltransferase n=1 Tax=Caballeronia sp. CLC5 TaxID=2906764 RepID=UPI001F3D60FC|nr:class I SAM-dependent methyltransferase [Caballeronia sp. CLC5]MCE4574351.1 class I SAM-dependent methyltransferase [Caballeronia sp. CLC5]BBP99735.1 ubiquinone/menaquinone biosynthesis methyltransferase [Burkholderia sp. SFA1]
MNPNTLRTDTQFAGRIPELYDQLLVPMLFETYATDIAKRAAALDPAHVLETAAGTGAVTRALARELGAHADIVATDLNQAMLDRASMRPIGKPVMWRQANALQLPFGDARFDMVVCQFGAMFFPDKTAAYAEAHRVLRPGGTLLFNVWDRIEENAFADTITEALGALFPDDPPLFMKRTPHGYFDLDAIARDLAGAGFDATPQFDTVTRVSRAPSAQTVAIAYCQGTPLRNEIEARPHASLDEATSACAAAIAARFGSGEVEGKIQAHVVVVKR